MKRACLLSLFLNVTASFLFSQSNPVPATNQIAGAVSPLSASQAHPKSQSRILHSYGKLPLSFEPNQGQADAQVKFLSRTSGYSLFLTGDEAVLTLHGSKPHTNNATLAAASHTSQSGVVAPGAGAVLRMKLRNANPAAKVTGSDELPGTSNYFIGNDPAKWRSGVPTYAKVKYAGVYSGIDLVYYGNERQLEYDFILAPGSDPHRIAFDVRGAKPIRRDARGDLVLNLSKGEIRWHRPVAYQEKDGSRQLVAARYTITGTNRVGFEVAAYDSSKPLYIDPLIYSTYLGGSELDLGYSIAVDSAGSAYVTGMTSSTDFPTTPGAFQTALNGSTNLFVAKLNPTGTALVYSTYLGGNGGDVGRGVAVDNSGNAYVTGMTSSTDFPTTPGAFQTTLNSPTNAFVAKLNRSGSALVYSTYLGGNGGDVGEGVAVDGAENAYVTGFTNSTDFPTTPGAFQATPSGSTDAFVAKLNPKGSALVYSTYLGGKEEDEGYGIAVDSAGEVYVTGWTSSTDFPTMNPLQLSYGGSDGDAFVTKFNAAGSALVYSTYLGGSGTDIGLGIVVDAGRNAYVTGETNSTNLPTMHPFQPAKSGGRTDAFVSKINPSGSALVYSTYLGGALQDTGYGIAVDSGGLAYISGVTCSRDFPTLNPLQAYEGSCDAFVSKLNASGMALVYSTFLGGGSSGSDAGYSIALDGGNNAYVTGQTQSTNFPTMNPLQPTNGGQGDAFVTKLYIAAGTTTVLSSSLNPSTYGQAVIFTASVTSGLGAPPDGETVTFLNGKTVLGAGVLSGGSASFTTSTLRVPTNAIKAEYVGDQNFAGSTSKPLSQVVGKATTSTTVVSSLNPSNVGQSVTFTATVTPQFGGTVTGTVTFYDGATALKTLSLRTAGAKFTTSTLASGTHTIAATYNGNTSFASSSNQLTQTVK